MPLNVRERVAVVACLAVRALAAEHRAAARERLGDVRYVEQLELDAAGDIRAEATEAVDAGVPLGPVEEGGRRKPDGSEIRWTVTDPYAFPLGGAVPFLIDWGSSVHPSTVTPGGLELLSFTMQHPDAQAVEHAFSALGLPIPVQRGEALRFEARLRGPGGEVSLS